MQHRSRRSQSLAFAVVAASSTAAAASDPLHEPFRVMTYNVRQVNADDTGIYAWTERSPDVIEVIDAGDPDIFGVQESSSVVIQEDLVDAFDADYDRFQPANGSPKTIFFRRARFERLVSPPEDGEGILAIGNPYPEDHACHPNASGRTAAWVKLRDLVSGRAYLVINAHVAHGATCHLARNASAAALHDLIAAQAGELTVVLMGDLNSDPQRATGGSEEDDIVPLLEAEQPAYKLARSARHSGNTNADTATFNSAWKQPSDSYTRLDYIFTSITDATTYWPSVDRREIDGISPSDHFAVLATIRTAPFTPKALVDDRGDGEEARLYFADVNGDGAADKLSWNPALAGDLVRVFLNDGAGAFGEPQSGAAAAAETSLYFADVDGDACADRIDWDPEVEGGRLRISRSQCDGSFAAPVAASDAIDRPAARLYFARLDADACADRIAWDPTGAGGQTGVALSRCDGDFDAEVVSDDAGTSTNPDAAMGFADVTGDGLADKIVWDPKDYEGRTRVYAGDGDGTFTFTSEHTGGTSGVAASRFYYGDIDGDGHADKIFWRHSFREGHPQLYVGHPDGFDAHPAMVNAGPSTSDANRYFLADLDGSGSLDLIAWDPATSGETRAYLALVHAPEDDEPPLDPTTGGGDGSSSGGDEGTTGASSGEPDAPTGSGGDVTSTGGPVGTASASDSDAPVNDGEAGCGCTNTSDGEGLVALVLGLGLVWRRRSRAP